MNIAHTSALEFARGQFALDPAGTHGEGHWTRVCVIGRRIGEQEGADLEIVELFALFHDLCRIGGGIDRGHGHRAAELARRCRRPLFDLVDDERFAVLWAALAGHDRREIDHDDITVRTCWDAERLELPRFGITPQPSLLYTETARRPEMIAWAAEASRTVGATLGTLPAAWHRPASLQAEA